jgi:N6-L-threonylcarbamoyladenine synthase
MLILGVESSCDETALALVKDGRTVICSLISSQMDIHAKWGGVIPEIAAREHLSAVRGMYHQLLSESSVSTSEIDAIAVTKGPGLVGCLLVGASFAKGLALATGKPLIPVNHVHAHVHGALLGIETDLQNIFPTLALVVSGGHTNLYYMKSPVHFELMAHTIDDACGESFDKVGKMLGLPYPGGPHVEALAARGRKGVVIMPKMVERKSQLYFSYSGLKTAVSLAIKSASTHNVSLADIAHSFQEEALGQIVRKLKVAVTMRPDTKSVIIAGGVAANARFKEIMAESIQLKTYFPPLKFCSDNAAMIAALAYHESTEPSLASQTHDLDWDVFSRYPFEKFLASDHPGF